MRSGFVVGRPTERGTRVSVREARDHLFGVVILNDWSARDIQAWEYVPLGPFLGKSFATSISAWVVPFEAFAEAEVDLPGQDPAVLPYLQGETDRDAFGLDLAPRGTDQRHGRQRAGVPGHVLVAGADAGAPDRQRRQPARR